MKKNDFKEIKGLDIKELTEKVKVIKKEIADLILDKNMKKLKDLKSISKKRKNLAQILTVMKQKELLLDLEKKTTGQSSNVSESKKKGRTELSKKK